MNTENMNLKGPMDEQLVQVKATDGTTRTMTLAEVRKEDEVLQRGIDLANRLTSKAMDQKDTNQEFLILRYAAIHLLGGQIFNIGMGSTSEVKGWDASRAFEAEKDVVDHLQSNVKAWKNLFDNGMIKHTKHKV
jgi:hypothetical protein